MTKNQENKRTMYEAVLSLLAANSALITPIPAFATSQTDFQNAVAKIESKSQEYNQATVGKAAMKNEALQNLIDAVMVMTSALSAYAQKQGNTVLKQKAFQNVSGLQRMRDTEVITRANEVLTLVNANTANLTDYGVTAAMITDFQQKIASFNTAVGEKESSVAERSGARESLSDLFRKADAILSEEIDQFVTSLKSTAPQFHTEYFAARMVKDIGLRHKTQPLTQPVNNQPAAGTQPNTVAPPATPKAA